VAFPPSGLDLRIFLGVRPSVFGLDFVMSITLEQLQTAFTPAPSPAPAPPGSCQLVDPKLKGYHLDATVAPDQVVAAAGLLDQHGFVIDTITGVDWMAQGQMEVIYDFFHLTAPWQVVVRTRVLRDQAEVPTISRVFPGANWHERETHEFFGIRFIGHPDLRPLLLPEDATFHPLRKDYAGAA
jgi:NADH-quinone oxidoreductase subunit C